MIGWGWSLWSFKNLQILSIKTNVEEIFPQLVKMEDKFLEDFNNLEVNEDEYDFEELSEKRPTCEGCLR